MFDTKIILKAMASACGIKQKEYINEYNERTGTNYSSSTLKVKINNGTLRVHEFQVLCDILGCYSCIVNKDNEDNKYSEFFTSRKFIENELDKKGISREVLRKEYETRTGKKSSQTGFAQKIRDQTFSVHQFQIICDIFGYKLRVISRENGYDFTTYAKPIETIVIGENSNE
jgi:hypothetical protein